MPSFEVTVTFKSKNIVVWIETDIFKEEYKEYFNELESMESIDFQQFDDINNAISNLKPIIFDEVKIIINSNLFSEFVQKFIENISNIKFTPKIIVFTKDKQSFIENNEEYINNNGNYYIFLE